MHKKLLARIKRKIFCWFKHDLDHALTVAEREKFTLLRPLDRATPLTLFNFAHPKEVTTETYRDLHACYGYARNNWAFDLRHEPEMLTGKRFFEFGAGNGAFVEFLQTQGKTAGGVDLINPRNVPSIIKGDFKDAFQSTAWKEAEIAYSADFLEHLDLAELSMLLGEWKSMPKKHIHLIACYDDAISHKTVMEPHAWALLFARYFASVEIRHVAHRRYPAQKLAVVLVCHG